MKCNKCNKENTRIKDPVKRKIAFEKQQLHDKIKNEYSTLNGIKLLRIKYDFKKIEELLSGEINGSS